jgi:hypothetical protein
MKIIVTTTIHHPTKAIALFDALEDWLLIVVGDKKTPEDYRLERGTYVSPADQERYDKALSDAIGWNCIQRRNFGMLMAYDMGADVIATVDDDNIPYDAWGSDLLLGREVEVDHYEIPESVFDPLSVTNHSELWHRGYPLQLLSLRNSHKPIRKKICAHVQADFWNGDPDVDAICRFEHAPVCNFDPIYFPFASNRPSPFDSQNTFLLPEVLPHYFIMPHVGRMDDIWPSYYVQAKGHSVVYGKPSVFQDRHEQDLNKNMRDEYLGYEKNLQLVQDLAVDTERLYWYLPSEASRAFDLFRRHFGAAV